MTPAGLSNRYTIAGCSRLGSDVFSSPSVVNGMVFVGSDDHNLHAFALEGRKRRR